MPDNIDKAIDLIKGQLEKKTKEAWDHQNSINNLVEKQERLEEETSSLNEALDALRSIVGDQANDAG